MTEQQLSSAAAAEYQALREEISQSSGLTMQIFTFTMTASVAVIAFGLERSDWRILGIVLLTLVPSGLMMLGRVETQMRVASYCRVVFEHRYGDLQWETALLANQGGWAADRLVTWAFYSAYVGVGLASLALAWVYGHSDLTARWVLGALSLLAAALLMLSMRLVLSRRRDSIARMYDACFEDLVTRSDDRQD